MDLIFVPDGGSRKNTAVLLVGTAEEFGLDQRSIRAAQGGFWITEELADVLYHESANNASGNRAEKNNKPLERE